MDDESHYCIIIVYHGCLVWGGICITCVCGVLGKCFCFLSQTWQDDMSEELKKPSGGVCRTACCCVAEWLRSVLGEHNKYRESSIESNVKWNWYRIYDYPHPQTNKKWLYLCKLEDLYSLKREPNRFFCDSFELSICLDVLSLKAWLVETPDKMPIELTLETS